MCELARGLAEGWRGVCVCVCGGGVGYKRRDGGGFGCAPGGKECACSRTLLSDALAGAAHLAVQLDHLEDGVLPAAAQMVEEAVVLFGEPVQHAEHVTCRHRWATCL